MSNTFWAVIIRHNKCNIFLIKKYLQLRENNPCRTTNTVSLSCIRVFDIFPFTYYVVRHTAFNYVNGITFSLNNNQFPGDRSLILNTNKMYVPGNEKCQRHGRK